MGVSNYKTPCHNAVHERYYRDKDREESERVASKAWYHTGTTRRTYRHRLQIPTEDRRQETAGHTLNYYCETRQGIES